MNPQDVKVGKHKVGPFEISVQRQPFTNKLVHDYFEVFVTEEFGVGLYYIDLHKDERFDVFAGLDTATKNIVKTLVDEMYQYDAHKRSMAMKFQMPTFLLSRGKIAEVFDKCQLAVDLIEVSPRTLDYCLTCRTYMVLCANCGNNCCNGGSGDYVNGEHIKCIDACRDAYRVQNAYWADNKSVTFVGQRVGKW